MTFRPRIKGYALTLPPTTSDRPSVLAFSLAKAGSTLFYNVLRGLAPHAGLVFYSAEDELFLHNIGADDRPTHVGSVFQPTGYCYGGFRSFPPFPIPILRTERAILLVRDPRDMAVSYYFSRLKSHMLPDGSDDTGARAELLKERAIAANLGIDRFVLRVTVPLIKRAIEGYIVQGFLRRPNVTIMRYEDIIFRKSEWVQALCTIYGWDIPAEVTEALAARFDKRPAIPQPEAHVRQVTPGDHRRQLAPGTIAQLNGAFAEYLRLFGYDDLPQA